MRKSLFVSRAAMFAAILAALTLLVLMVYSVILRPFCEGFKEGARQEREREVTIPVEQPRAYVEHTPPVYKPDLSVKAEFPDETISLAERCISEEDLRTMAEEDGKFADKSSGRENFFKEYDTPAGKFKVVYCFGRYSINPKARNSGGFRYETIQLPNGKWYRAFPGPLSVSDVFTIHDRTYLVVEKYVLEWVGGPNGDRVKVAVVINGHHSCYLRGWYCDRFVGVYRTNSSDFGGLLVCRENGWNFVPYRPGEEGVAWIEKVEEVGKDTYRLDLYDQRQVVFDGKEFKEVFPVPPGGGKGIF